MQSRISHRVLHFEPPQRRISHRPKLPVYPPIGLFKGHDLDRLSYSEWYLFPPLWRKNTPQQPHTTSHKPALSIQKCDDHFAGMSGNSYKSDGVMGTEHSGWLRIISFRNRAASVSPHAVSESKSTPPFSRGCTRQTARRMDAVPLRGSTIADRCTIRFHTLTALKADHTYSTIVKGVGPFGISRGVSSGNHHAQLNCFDRRSISPPPCGHHKGETVDKTPCGNFFFRCSG